jgi:competence protein ComFC
VLKNLFDDFQRGVIDLLYPRRCILCKAFFPHSQGSETQEQLCPGCEDRVLKNRPPFCRKCSRPIEDDKSFCRVCERSLFSFDRVWAACVYDDTMRRLIHLFKYGNKTALRHSFGKWIFNFLKEYHVPLEQFDLTVPVPLHPTRRRERGFNQAEILCQKLCERFPLNLSADNLVRVRHTRNQAVLGPKGRALNVHGAFKIKNPAAVKDKNILLVDDLYTTGATASEAAGILKEAGANGVSVLTVAIAV